MQVDMDDDGRDSTAGEAGPSTVAGVIISRISSILTVYDNVTAQANGTRVYVCVCARGGRGV